MNKIVLCCLLYIFAFTAVNSNAQTLDYSWIKKAGGSYTESGTSVATDANGNVIVAGTFFSSTITFGSITLTKADSSSARMFVVKYSPNGDPLWAKMATTSPIFEETSGYAVTTDPNGDIYVGGDLKGDTVSFDALTIVLPQPYDNAAFLVKYTEDGTVVWAKMGLNGRGAGSVTADANGDVYFTGIFNNQINFDNNLVNSTGSSYGIFLAKYNSSGNFIWANATNYSYAGNGTPDAGSGSVCTDLNHNVYTSGFFGSDTVFFDSLHTIYVTNTQSVWNAFIARYDNAGNALWARGAISTPSLIRLSGNSVKTFGNSVYLAGEFEGDSALFGSNLITNSGEYSEIFLTKYDNMGNNLWAKSLGTESYDYGKGLAMDNDGNIYVTGTTNGKYFQLNAITLDTIVGGNNTIVAKFDANGNFLVRKTPLNILYGQSSGHGIAIDANDNIFVTGSFNNSVCFGMDTLTSYNLWDDIFIAKLNNVITSISAEKPMQSKLKIFPNPSIDFIVIEMEEKNEKVLEAEIYNTMGDLVQTEVLYSNYTKISTRELSNGVYILTVKSKDFLEKQKFIIQR